MKHNAISIMAGLAVGFGLCLCTQTARANVYATNIKINGDMTNSVSVGQGSTVNISYILNEAATAGVTVKILSGQNVVRTISIASGAGTTKGSHTIAWDGKDGSGATVPLGAYKVSITAAATGYSDWTQISDDTVTNFYMNAPYGVAVNNNPSSPYYGRVIVSNVTTNGSDMVSFGNVLGLYKFNADGSYSDDGAGRFGLAQYAYTDDGGDVPILLKIKEDDRLYFNDWVNAGKVVATDMLLTTNEVVLDAINYSANPYSTTVNFVDFNVTDILTDHARVYMTDANYPSAGAWYWPMTNGVTDMNSPGYTSGYQAVATGGDLSLRCDGIIVDAKTNVYVMQNRANPGDSNMRVCAFTNWDGVTALFSGASWIVGGGDDTFRNLRGIAMDSLTNPKYLAISMTSAGTASATGQIAGGIRILNPADGSTIYTNLDAKNFYRCVNFDNVGNLYAGGSRTVGQTPHRWRIFSPPGANQATTIAFSTVDVIAAPTPIQVSSISLSGGNAVIRFTSSSTDPAAAFTLESATSPAGTFGVAAGANITQVSPGVFQATVAATGPATFYRIKK